MTSWPKPVPDSAEQPSAEDVLTAQILETLREGLLLYRGAGSQN